ncbi:MAG: O-antigen ligase family protein [Deltaproteobacteria bacterium]|nr:O-antigen ligase family protein [Deltaproteobacteria bacterium]
MRASQILPQTGPVLLALMCLAQGFSRGVFNTCYGLLVLWGMIWLIWGRRSWGVKVSPLPKAWVDGLMLLVLALFLTSAAGDLPYTSLKTSARHLYVCAAAPLAWLALSHNPKVVGCMPYLYGLGLAVSGVVTFFEAGLCVQCVRAKGTLGAIELSGVLGQIPPVLVGAMAAVAPRDKRKIAKIVFLLACLAASYAALRTNCGRIAIICAPLLMAVMFFANLKKMTPWLIIALVVPTLAGGVMLALDYKTAGRFGEMLLPAEDNLNNHQRFAYWKQGLEYFRAHPVLGVGPGAKPAPPEYSRGPGHYSHSHNIYLTFLSETGIVGLACFLIFLTAPMRLLWRFRKSPDALIFFWTWAAMVVFLQMALNGVTDFAFGNRVIAVLHLTVMGAALWVAYGRLPEPAAAGRKTAADNDAPEPGRAGA